MLFVALLKTTPGTVQERVARRVEWEYPEGTQVVAEYWLQTLDPLAIFVCEADHISELWTLFGEWNDIFDISIFRLSGSSRGIPHIWGYGIIGEKFWRLCYAEHCGSQIARHDFNSFGYS